MNPGTPRTEARRTGPKPFEPKLLYPPGEHQILIAVVKVALQKRSEDGSAGQPTSCTKLRCHEEEKEEKREKKWAGKQYLCSRTLGPPDKDAACFRVLGIEKCARWSPSSLHQNLVANLCTTRTLPSRPSAMNAASRSSRKNLAPRSPRQQGTSKASAYITCC